MNNKFLGNLIAVRVADQDGESDVILDEVFKRIGVDEKEFKNTVVNIGTGELVIEEPKKPKDEKVQK